MNPALRVRAHGVCIPFLAVFSTRAPSVHVISQTFLLRLHPVQETPPISGATNLARPNSTRKQRKIYDGDSTSKVAKDVSVTP